VGLAAPHPALRLFFAIELPAEVRAALGRLRGDDLAYRWVEPGALHVTLAFLGEQPESRVAQLEDIASAATRGSTPGTLKIGQPGSFGSRGAPRVLWIGLDGDVAKLLQLQAQLSDGLKQAGFGLEEREWRPHITLARRREHAASRALAWPPASVAHTAFPLHSLVLFQSKLSPKGPTYIALREFDLRGT
jgi:RNA 2',3'-cyclic 3'-phosphodiesterase